MNRSLLEKTRSLMLEANVSKKLWIGVNITTYFYNFSPTRSNPCITHKNKLFRKETRPFLSTHFWLQSFCAHS
jgi:hypothetical protein